jgi:hypothetical protein
MEPCCHTLFRSRHSVKGIFTEDSNSSGANKGEVKERGKGKGGRVKGKGERGKAKGERRKGNQ